jgi:hypothetical protein
VEPILSGQSALFTWLFDSKATPKS